MPNPRTNRRRQRHHGGATQLFEFLAGDQIVGAVGQHDETVFDQDFGGFERAFVIGKQRVGVADHFEFDPVGIQQFARELRGQTASLTL